MLTVDNMYTSNVHILPPEGSLIREVSEVKSQLKVDGMSPMLVTNVLA